MTPAHNKAAISGGLRFVRPDRQVFPALLVRAGNLSDGRDIWPFFEEWPLHGHSGGNFKQLIQCDTSIEARADIAIVRNGGKGPLEPLLASPFDEQYIGLSPDGRYMCFVSDQSGRPEVYVRDLAGEQDQVLVSLEGGSEPVWSRDGRELFYRETKTGDPYLVAAAIATGAVIAVTGRKRLFPIGDIVGSSPHANYDVSPDGRSFVMVRRSQAARIIVIQNLPALVRRLRGERAPA